LVQYQAPQPRGSTEQKIPQANATTASHNKPSRGMKFIEKYFKIPGVSITMTNRLPMLWEAGDVNTQIDQR
jgi:hypothetical protein